MSGPWAVFYYFLVTIHVLACIIMVLSILLQSGRSAGLGLGFGGTGQMLFGGGGGASFLAKFTAVCAAIFVVTSISIAKVGVMGDRSLERKARVMAPTQPRHGEEVKIDDLKRQPSPPVPVAAPTEEAALAPSAEPPPAPVPASEGVGGVEEGGAPAAATSAPPESAGPPTASPEKGG